MSFISFLYGSELRQKLAAMEKNLNKVQLQYQSFSENKDKLLDNYMHLERKYKKAKLDYETDIVNAIRLPVYVYSGKIIQNYPLGLGVNTIVEDNQIRFETGGKEKTDVINILSTGQLNGLAISIMLAIRSVYCEKFGLGMLLIDDPLQTVDDISSISLVDLLLNCDINQLIMSTHENEKATMITYKYNQRGFKINTVNMKDEYMTYISGAKN